MPLQRFLYDTLAQGLLYHRSDGEDGVVLEVQRFLIFLGYLLPIEKVLLALRLGQTRLQIMRFCEIYLRLLVLVPQSSLYGQRFILSIDAYGLPVSMPDPVRPRAPPLPDITPNHLPFTVPFIVLIQPPVNSPIRPTKFAHPVHLPLNPIACVYFPVVPGVCSLAVKLVMFELPVVGLLIKRSDLSLSFEVGVVEQGLLDEGILPRVVLQDVFYLLLANLSLLFQLRNPVLIGLLFVDQLLDFVVKPLLLNTDLVPLLAIQFIGIIPVALSDIVHEIPNVDICVGFLPPSSMPLPVHPNPLIRVLHQISIDTVMSLFPVLYLISLGVRPPSPQLSFDELPLHTLKFVVLSSFSVKVGPQSDAVQMFQDLCLDLALRYIASLVEFSNSLGNIVPSVVVKNPLSDVVCGLMVQIVNLVDSVLRLRLNLDLSGSFELPLIELVLQQGLFGFVCLVQLMGVQQCWQCHPLSVGFLLECRQLIELLHLVDDPLAVVHLLHAALIPHGNKFQSITIAFITHKHRSVKNKSPTLQDTIFIEASSEGLMRPTTLTGTEIIQNGHLLIGITSTVPS